MATFPIEELVPLVAPPAGEAVVALAVAASGSGTGEMMSNGRIRTAVNPCIWRKKRFKQNTSSPGNPARGGKVAAASRPNATSLKIFRAQKSSASAASRSSAHSSVGTAVKPWARRKKTLKQNNRPLNVFCPRCPPQAEDWDLEISVTANGLDDVTGVALQESTLNGLVTGGYIPAVHHVPPVNWVRESFPTEPDQFADAEDPAGMPPQVEEWDREIQDVATKLYSVTADGLKDSVASQDLTHLLTGGYIPAVHHVQTIKWVRESFPIEPDQFTDADE
ncbi:uncharacterized protein isoform X1 [Takifugu rubripes]|uniref:uncharacterized protein isoform X1 n=1 Tax=Takifugu rubripes TaxID=31033 RepID=UPI00114590BA|nr:uncharacterized protein LOC105417625 isoform X1 [Takifugu rubripes]